MAKTSTAPASAEKTSQKVNKTIEKPKKLVHPWKGQRIAFVGPFIYQETNERTVVMLEDEESTAPLLKKLGAEWAGHEISKKTRVVVLGDSERMVKGEVWPRAENQPHARTSAAHPRLKHPRSRDCSRAHRRTRCSRR